MIIRRIDDVERIEGSIEVKGAEERARVKPAGEEGYGFRREIGEAPISQDLGLGAWNKDCRRTVILKPHMPDFHNGEF